MTNDQTKLLENAQQVAVILKQLANPYRLMILCSISSGELTVGDLNEQVDLSQSALSQHLAKLRESELRGRAILENAIDAIITIDEKGIIEDIILKVKTKAHTAQILD